MVCGRHAEKVDVEDLVLMVIDCDILCVGIRWSKESVPVIGRLESIVQDNRCVRDLSNLAVSIAVELLSDIETEIVEVKSRFVE